MDETKFWEILALAELPSDDQEGDVERAREALSKLSIEDIQKFEVILSEKLYSLDTRAHAKGSLEGEDDFFSNDGFLYKRCYVVACGKEKYEDVLANPGNMPKDLMLEFEEVLYLPNSSYELKTGGDMLPASQTVSAETGSNLAGWAQSTKDEAV